MNDSLFRTLSKAETLKFQHWARENYKPGSPVDECWHPVIRAEIDKMIADQKA